MLQEQVKMLRSEKVEICNLDVRYIGLGGISYIFKFRFTALKTLSKSGLSWICEDNFFSQSRLNRVFFINKSRGSVLPISAVIFSVKTSARE
jgi:hypothetical protein